MNLSLFRGMCRFLETLVALEMRNERARKAEMLSIRKKIDSARIFCEMFIIAGGYHLVKVKRFQSKNPFFFAKRK